MGGDHAPLEIVRGALLAAEDPKLQVLLVGRRDAVVAALASARRRSGQCGTVETVDASEVIEMHEPPAQAVRRKKDASMVVCGELVRSGRADAMVSAGNTGAAMAVALTKWGRICGIDRPAIATSLPTMTGRIVLLDAGANVDCSPQNLLQFGLMGSVYAEKVLGVARPRVGLLSNGEEAGKGNEQIRAAYALLSESSLHFVGNVEGRESFHGGVDVVVCDGFVGNVVLKVGEGVVELLRSLVKQELQTQPWLKIPAALLAPAVRQIRRRTDYSETGGAPLLGVDGICIISHGRSSARAIANAIRAAGEAVRHGIVEQIGRQLAGSSSDAR
jgi:glycerol-3-phosphate acyltransferase PlsX